MKANQYRGLQEQEHYEKRDSSKFGKVVIRIEENKMNQQPIKKIRGKLYAVKVARTVWRGGNILVKWNMVFVRRCGAIFCMSQKTLGLYRSPINQTTYL